MLVLVLTGCSVGPAIAPLDGRQFLSVSVIDQGAAHQLVPGTRISIRFADGRLSASAGCNMMGAAYRLDGERLFLDQAATTEMGCDGPRHAQDEWLFGFLGSGPTLRLAGSDLTLESGGTVVRFLDGKVAEPDLPLIGPTWKVVSIISGETVSSVPDDAVATLQFQDDGQVRIATGCNEGGAQVTVDAETLRFEGVVLTERACPGPEGQLEAAVLAVLRANAVTFQIDAQTLELRAGERGLQLGGR